MTEHPASFDIEAWHAGENLPDVAAHVATCAACRVAADELDAARDASHARTDPIAMARRVRARADAQARASRRWTFWGALGGAAAVALVTLVLSPSGGAPPAAAPGLSVESGRMKAAGPGLAVVVLRDGAQARHAASVTLHAGDRLRVELTVPRPSVLTVGVLQDDGAFVPLVEGRSFDAGVHFLEPALALDDAVVGGRVVAGPPDAVGAFVLGKGAAVSVLPLEVAP